MAMAQYVTRNEMETSGLPILPILRTILALFSRRSAASSLASFRAAAAGTGTTAEALADPFVLS